MVMSKGCSRPLWASNLSHSFWASSAISPSSRAMEAREKNLETGARRERWRSWSTVAKPESLLLLSQIHRISHVLIRLEIGVPVHMQGTILHSQIGIHLVRWLVSLASTSGKDLVGKGRIVAVNLAWVDTDEWPCALSIGFYRITP